MKEGWLSPSTPATMSKQHCWMLQIERFFRQSQTLLRHCCRFWQRCWMKFRCFDKVETNWTRSICFDFERTKLHLTLLPKTATVLKQCSTFSKGQNFTINLFDIVAILATSEMLLRHCYWCERGYTVVVWVSYSTLPLLVGMQKTCGTNGGRKPA